MPLLIVLAVLLAINAAAYRYGVDSRDGGDWQTEADRPQLRAGR